MYKKNKNKNKKTVVIVLIAAAALIPVLIFLNMIDWDNLARGIKSKNLRQHESEKDRFDFSIPDYDENIFEDKEYINKNRYISYTIGAQSCLLTEDNIKLFGEPAKFFSDYFETAVNGDAEKLNSFYSDDYFKIYDKYEKFTMQKIYNIEIIQQQKSIIDDGSKFTGYTRYMFVVRYMIMDNNGTFRSDMGSDAAVPLIFEVLSYGSKMQIYGVYPYILE